MKKLIIIAGLIFPMIASSAVVDAIFTKGMKGLDAVFARHSIDSAAKIQIKESIEASLIAISSDGKRAVNFDDLNKVVAASSSSSDEIKRLKTILAKDPDKLSKEEVGELVNGLVYVALSKGQNNSKFLTCDSCAGDSVAALGIKSVARIPKVGSTAAKISKSVPTSDRALTRHLKAKFKKFDLGNYAKHAAGNIKKENKRSLAMFLGFLEKGTKEEKALASAILKFNTDDNSASRLLENNKLWKIFDYIPADKMDVEKRNDFMTKFAALLDELGDEKVVNGNRNNNLTAYIERRVKEDPSLKKYYSDFSNKQLPCWGL